MADVAQRLQLLARRLEREHDGRAVGAAARAYAGGQPSAITTRCANVCLPIRQRVPVHAASCRDSGSSVADRPQSLDDRAGTSAPFGIAQ